VRRRSGRRSRVARRLGRPDHWPAESTVARPYFDASYFDASYFDAVV